MNRTILILAGLGVSAALMGCATSIDKQKMTLGEANIEGMECRREKPIGTQFYQTVCASPEAWAQYDEATEYETDLAFEQGRSMQNAGAFNRR